MTIKKKTLDDGLTNKQRILRMVERWDDDIPFEQALYHMSVMQAVMEGIKDIEAGRTTDHDEVFDELERRCDEEESKAALVGSIQKRPRTAAKKDRGTGRAKNGPIVRKPAEKIRKPAS
jgi:predicted transcriptional regulator